MLPFFFFGGAKSQTDSSGIMWRACRVRGMKDRVDKSMGIVTNIAEALVGIEPTDPLRSAKREARKKRKCSDS